MRLRTFTFSFAVLAVSLPVFAQDADDDGPGRGVARVSLINGDVSMKRGDSGDWSAAAPNAPLVVGDSLFTGPGSRAEMQFDYANMLRLAANAEVRLAELENKRYLVQVAKGLVTFRVLRTYEDIDVEISTPSISVRPTRKGIYRIHVREDGSTEVSVRSGEAEIFTPRGTQRLGSGRTMMARGTAADPEFQLVADVRDDDWDRWNQNRDRQLERSRSYDYVSRDVYGAEDLDGHGSWVNVAPYGNVWQPYVSVGWSPYRNGRWSWVDWYGWTWVSYDAWGWAPYHYGRWFNSGNRWCWWPGGLRSRHYWRPALVSFFGWGGGGIGIGFGRVGWVPLAPYEAFRPWYGRGFYGGYRNGGFNNRNMVVNNVNITNVYRNARVRDGYTVVDGRDFSNGRVNAIRGLNDGEMRRASLVQGQVPVVPERGSLRVADREPSRFGISGNDRFHSRRAPAQVERATFDQQRSGLEQVARRSFAGDGARGGRSESVAAAPGRSADIGAGRGDSGARSPAASGRSADIGAGRGDGSVRSFESPGRSADAGSQRAERSAGQGTPGGRSADADQGGWRRFGAPVNSAVENSTERGGNSSVGRSADANPGRQSSESDNGGWRRFGEPGRSAGTGATRSERTVEQPRTPDSGRSADSDRGGWRRFGDVNSQPRSSDSGRSSDPGVSQRRSENSIEGSRGGDTRRSADDSGALRRMDSPRPERQGGRSSDEPVRISPPIVRERSSPRSNDSGAGRSRSEPRSYDFGSSSRSGSSDSGGGRVFGGSNGGGGRSSDSGGGSRMGSWGGGRSSDSGGGGRISGGGGGGRSSSGGGGSRMSSGGGGGRVSGGGRSSGGGGGGGGGRTGGGGRSR